MKCLRLTEIRIPTHAIRNKEAILECNFDLDREELYSVKWYKDGHEFFRFEPKRNPPGQKFNLRGVYVDVSNNSVFNYASTYASSFTHYFIIYRSGFEYARRY